MKSKDLKNAIRVGEIVISEKETKSKKYCLYKNSLKIIWDLKFPSDLKKKHLSIVYFLLVDDIVYKIGQTTTSSGISGCLNFYMNAGLDDPGMARFAINYLMREEIKKGKKIEVYIQYGENVTYNIKGIFDEKEVVAPPSAKQMEDFCIKQFVEKEKIYPKWNFQESLNKYPNIICEKFSEYKKMRSKI